MSQKLVVNPVAATRRYLLEMAGLQDIDDFGWAPEPESVESPQHRAESLADRLAVVPEAPWPSQLAGIRALVLHCAGPCDARMMARGLTATAGAWESPRRNARQEGR